MSTFYLLWQDPFNRQWHPAGRLDRVGEWYVFAYVRDAFRSPSFLPFAGFGDTRSIYLSQNLFPLFANRVLSDKRPEFQLYARWVGYDKAADADPLMLMAQLGGVKATDSLQVYAVPERNYLGEYRSLFFCHGVSHMSHDAQARTLSLRQGEQLFPMLDIQNPHDGEAIALRTSDPACLVGYSPRHLTKDLKRLANSFQTAPRITVSQVNRDAPAQFRVLCEAVAPWPTGFQPCSGDEYKTVVDYSPAQVVAHHTSTLVKQAASWQR